MEGETTSNYERAPPPLNINNRNINNNNDSSSSTNKYSNYHSNDTNQVSLEAITTSREDTSNDKLDSMVNNPIDDGEEEELPFLQAVRRYPKIAAYCLALTTSILLWGYDLVVVSSVTGVPAFQRDFGEPFDGNEAKYIFPSNWLSLWLAFGPLGSAVGSLAGGWLQDRAGRKRCLLAGSVLSAAAVVVIFLSDQASGLEARRGVFLLGKTVQGFAVGFIKIQALTYVSENAPTSLRGPAMALFPTFTLLGQLIGSAVIFAIERDETSRGYHVAFGSQWVLSAAPFILSFALPESPAWLVRKGRTDQALRSAKRLFEPRVSAAAALERITHTVTQERNTSAEAVTYRNCFGRANRRRTGIIVFVNLLPALFGLNLMSNASYFMQTVGMGARKSLMFMILGVVLGILANAASVWVLSRVGRRRLTVVTLAAAGVLWTSMGLSSFWLTGPAITYAGVSMILVILVVGVGAWPAGYAIMGETSALRLRARSQAVGGVAQQASSILMSFVLPYIFNLDAGALKAKTGFVFAGLCAVATAVAWLCIPEMKGRSIDEIDQMFRLGLRARDFKKWRGSVEEMGRDPAVGGQKNGSAA